MMRNQYSGFADVPSILVSICFLVLAGNTMHAQQGNLFVSINSGPAIDQVTVPGGAVGGYAIPSGPPEFLTFDSVGNLFVSNFGGAHEIQKITPSGVVSDFVASGLTGQQGLAFDSSGFLYSAGSGGIAKIDSGGSWSSFASASNGMGLAFDNSGNLYEADNGTG